MYAQCRECLTVSRSMRNTLGRGHRLAILRGTAYGAVRQLHTLIAQLPPEPFEHLPPHRGWARPPLLSVPCVPPASGAEATLDSIRTQRAARSAAVRRGNHAAPQFASGRARRALAAGAGPG